MKLINGSNRSKQLNRTNQLQLKNWNIFTVDLEDYFMVSAFANVVKRQRWDRYESRIERNTYRLLEILDEDKPPNDIWGLAPCGSHRRTHTSQKGTFFCLGWIAERYPHLIKGIQSRGHEIASHGYNHREIASMSPKDFREDIRKSKAILEDLTGRSILGYRAPSYSITFKTFWALEVLAEEGFSYDSSVFPIYHDRYGIPNAPRFPFLICLHGETGFKFIPLTGLKNLGARSSHPTSLNPTAFGSTKIHSLIAAFFKGSDPKSPDNANALCLKRSAPSTYSLQAHSLGLAVGASLALIEFPLSTIRILGQNIAVAGGGYFRLFPIMFTQWALKRIQERDSLPFVFYIHPWEIDPDQPRVNGVPFKLRFRHSINLRRTEDRLRKLLRQFSFFSFRDLINHSGFRVNN